MTKPEANHIPHETDFTSPYSLQTRDWNREWMDAHAYRAHKDSKPYWNKRSKTFDSADNPSEYVRTFLKMCNISPDETVFDMGCGTGSTTIPLAQMGCKVVAADFSDGMLEQLQARAHRLLDHPERHITIKNLSWEEDWSQAGMLPNSFDVALASRSIATDNFDSVINKLSTVARRRCCITLPTSISPRIDVGILHDIGIDLPYGRAYQYVWNILVNKGYEPECRFIESDRRDTYNNEEDAWGSFSRMLDAAIPNARPEERDIYDTRMRNWIRNHIVPNENAGKLDDRGEVQKALRLDHPRKFSWAYVSWKTSK